MSMLAISLGSQSKLGLLFKRMVTQSLGFSFLLFGNTILSEPSTSSSLILQTASSMQIEGKSGNGRQWMESSFDVGATRISLRPRFLLVRLSGQHDFPALSVQSQGGASPSRAASRGRLVAGGVAVLATVGGIATPAIS